MGRTAVIFPGQGAQVVGMGRDVAEAHPKAAAVFARANEVLGFDLRKLCFEGPAEEIEKTDIQQPAIFVTSVAVWEAFLEAGGKAGFFSCTGGLSLGEYTALHVAGAIGFDDAVRLVRKRGQLMQEAAEASPSGMVSLIGADEESAAAVCDKARQDDVLVAANFNCPGQVVISGSSAACERAVSEAEQAGLRAIKLGVAGAFHSPLMSSAAEGLGQVLAETAIDKAQIPALSNVSANYHGEPGEIREFLQQQVTHPVLWQRCIEKMIEDGVDRFVEMGPGRVLTGMMRKINRKLPTVCINSADAIGTAVAELAG